MRKSRCSTVIEGVFVVLSFLGILVIDVLYCTKLEMDGKHYVVAAGEENEEKSVLGWGLG